MRGKKVLAVILTGALTASLSLTAFAGQWQKDENGWWWQEDDGSYPVNTVKFIDADSDGTGEGYYFDENGYVYRCTVAGDESVGLSLDAWLSTQLPQKTGDQVQHNEGYNPEHPLANKIDEWGLRVPVDYYGFSIIGSESLQARLTGQMDYYNYLDIANYAPLVDGMYVAERNGTTFYVDEESYNAQKEREQIIYEWFCNWLNSMDFENMTEAQRANEIIKVLQKSSYDYEGEYTANLVNEPYQEYYAILIEHSGVCRDFAVTACALAKALGLRSATDTYKSIQTNHLNYFIEVDGNVYKGSNNAFSFTSPVTDPIILSFLN